jgi:2'-5' RNA ligase
MIRLFVALRPPAHIRTPLIAAMGGIPGARWQNDDQLHLTLAFLGETDERTANAVDAFLSSLRSPTLEIILRGIGHFGPPDCPNTLWIGAEPREPLAALAAKVTRACRQAGAEIERRAFVPHVTLARLNRSSGSTLPFLSAQGDWRSAPWTADSFTLFESRLGTGGSAYIPLIDYPLI